MEKTENYKKEVSQINKRARRIGIYFSIIFLSIVINILALLFGTWHITSHITNYLTENIQTLNVKKPIIFFDGVFKIYAIDLMINIFILLAIEFIAVSIFKKRLNKFFLIDGLFTTKRFFFLAIIIIGIQMIFSFILWNI